MSEFGFADSIEWPDNRLRDRYEHLLGHREVVRGTEREEQLIREMTMIAVEQTFREHER